MFYARVGEEWTAAQKLRELEDRRSVVDVHWTTLKPNDEGNWFCKPEDVDFDSFTPMGLKEQKSNEDVPSIFQMFSPGVVTARDPWAYSFDQNQLAANINKLIATYDGERAHVVRARKVASTYELTADDHRIKWTDRLKEAAQANKDVSFDPARIRWSVYRPFTKERLYFDELLNQRRYQQHHFFPITSSKNSAIAVTGHDQVPFSVQLISEIPCSDVGGRPGQVFPFYTYDEDGSNRRENITDWALNEFRTHYADKTITKWDIFHYTYALLHHPEYRTRYAANLKRELPRIPYAPDFRAFVKAGERLADLHVNYEKQPEYPLEHIENPNAKGWSWRVEKMRLGKDKTSLFYNEHLTLSGIPPETYEYRLGNRSALEWVIDQYQVSTDKRSGITNDPHREDDPEYIARLIGQVIHVSVETVKIVNALPELGLEKATGASNA